MTKKKRLFTGLQPTGTLHLGNLIGAILPVASFQEKYETFVSVVDLHAITTEYDAKKLPDQCFHLLAGLIASGVKPEKVALFVQSQVPEHAELSWLFNTLTGIGQLNRMTQFKEKKEREENISAGLLNYPILQAADILLYKGQAVPVGEDQSQHLELARMIARRFNSQFGETFPEPETLLPKDGARVMALNDPMKKMSKSLPGSFVALTDTDQEITKKIKRAVTDTGDDSSKEMSPGLKNLFSLLRIFSSKEAYSELQGSYTEGKLRYSDLKGQIIQDVIRTLTPIREGIVELEQKKDHLREIADSGAKRASAIAKETMIEVREKMGLFSSIVPRENSRSSLRE